MNNFRVLFNKINLKMFSNTTATAAAAAVVAVAGAAATAADALSFAPTNRFILV